MTATAGIGSCLVAGAGGQVGEMFVTSLTASGVKVTAVDLEMPPPEARRSGVDYLRGDVTGPDDEMVRRLAGIDMVLLGVPEAVALAAAPRLTAAMPPGSLLVDTLSVKTPFARAIGELAPPVEAVSINPMFAPSLGMAGRPVAVVPLRPGPRVDGFLRMLTGWGAVVVPTGADDHDRLTATVQVATHAAVLAFGLAVRDLGTDVADLATVAAPPHLTLLALLARITSAAPETYRDIQVANPYAVAARAALAAGVERLGAASSPEAGVAGFTDLFTGLRDHLGTAREPLAQLCAELFAQLPTAPGSLVAHRQPPADRG